MLSYSAIACIDSNGALGYQNDLLFKSKTDLQNFKEITNGNIVIMGRKTADSIISMGRGNLLPNRTKMILTRDKEYQSKLPNKVAKETFFYDSLDSMMYALNLLSAFYMSQNEEKEVFVIGGEQIYSIFAPHINKLYLTEVNKTYKQVDAWFPIPLDSFKLESSKSITSEPIKFSINTYTRKEEQYV